MTDKSFESPLLPLTDAQRDIVFDQLHLQNSAIYNIGGRIDLKNIDVERLQQAHQQLVNDHPAFRLHLVFDQGDIYQRLGSDADSTLTRLSFADALSPRQAAKSWLKAEFSKPFDLKAKCLYRAFLLDLGDDCYWYVGMSHHIINDGWGFSNWVKYLADCYNDLAPSSFADEDWRGIITGQQQYHQSVRFAKDEAFWLDYCHDCEAGFLPANYAKLYSLDDPQSRREILSLSPEEYAGLFGANEYLQKNLQSLFIAAIAVYFSKVYGRDSLTLGVPSHNRKGAGQKTMVGLFSAVNLMRVSIDDSLSNIELVDEVIAQQRKIFRHKQFPIGEIARKLRRNAIPDLYEVGFNYLRLDGEIHFGDTRADYFYDPNDHQALPINFGLWEAGDHNIALQIDYNNSYFEQREIVLIKNRLLYLIKQMALNPTQPVKQLCCVTDEERTLMQFNNATAQNFNLTKTVSRMFEEYAELMPDKIALRTQQDSLSYSELNREAQKYAVALHQSGIRQGDLVGICLNRSTKLVVSLLALQKLGAAFLPLDPNYPGARLNYMIAHSKVKTLIVESGLEQNLNTDALTLVDFDQMVLSGTALPLEALGNHAGQLPAYVIYTSGSTGKPKGVTVSNRALSNFLQSMAVTPGIGINDTLLAVTPFSFDIALLELFLPLTSGACLYLFEHRLSENLEQLKAILERCEVNMLQMTPSAWKLLLATGWQGNPEMRALAGGESLSNDLAAVLKQKVNTLWNMYGPTETTIWSTCTEVGIGQYFNNIGKPIANTVVHILDKQLNQVPMAVEGDLYLSGAGLAEGYLFNPVATEEAFIQWQGKQLYKTGDRARLTVTGEIEYIGRSDSQVKISGHRIELNEIQSHLSNHPDIQDSVVKAVTLADGRDVLVAYYTAANPPAKSDLAGALAEVLPKFMLPSYYLHLQKMPLTPSGKTDVKNLPLPQLQTAAELDEETLDKLGETEVAIYQCIAEVVGNGKFNPVSNFFEVGANSNDMLTITNALNGRLGSNLSIIDVFTYPSVTKLAAFIEQDKPKAPVQEQRQNVRKKGKALLNRQLNKKQQRKQLANEN